MLPPNKSNYLEVFLGHLTHNQTTLFDAITPINSKIYRKESVMGDFFTDFNSNPITLGRKGFL